MKSIFLIALGNIRRRKKQNVVTGLTIFLSVLLLTTATGIIGGIHKPFDTMFDRLRASHILLYYDHRQQDPEKIKKWFENQPEVTYVSNPHYFLMVTEPMMINGKKIDIMMRITEYDQEQEKYDHLLQTQGTHEDAPGWGETWIPRHLAVKYHVSAGDTLLVPLSGGLYPLTVSAIVIDPHFVSGMINPNRIWVARGMLPFMVSTTQLNEVMQGVRLKSKQDIEQVRARFNREMNYPGSSLQYGLFKSVFTSLYNIIGLVILIFSLLAIIISGYIISSIITSTLLADSKQAGILMAIGFMPVQLTSIYLLQYLLLMLIAVPAGLLTAYVSIRTILNTILKSIGLVNFSFPFFIIFLGSTLFIFLVTLLLVWGYARKSGKMSPVRALQSISGDTNIYRKKKRFPLNKLLFSLPFWIGMKLLLDNPRKGFTAVFSTVLTIFMLGFALNISHSFNQMNHYKSRWGFDNADLQVFRSSGVILPVEHEKFIEAMHHVDMISELVPFSYYELTIPAGDSTPPLKLNGKVFEVTPAMIGLGNIRGKHPAGSDEISLCVGTARKLQKDIGDRVEVSIEQEHKYFTISGIYQDISNLGEGFRLSVAAVQAVNPIYKPDRYAIILKDKKQTGAVRKFLHERYGETISFEPTIEEQLGFMGVTKSINASMLLISIFFAGVLMASVFSDVFLNIWEKRLSVGIYKLIGFRPSQLRMIMIWKTIVLTICGILLGIPLILLLAPRLMSMITSGYGVVDFPFIFTFQGTVAASLLLLLAALLSAWLASRHMKKINAQILVNE